MNGHVLIQAKDIDVECAGRKILDIAQLEIYEYDRIGLVGANGVGKTTLMKVLLGENQWQNGIVKHGDIKRNGTFSYFSQLDDPNENENMDGALLGKLAVDRVQIGSMSGGEETRLKMAQVLSADAHGIFADEPTSYLDREGLDFLIQQLKHYHGALLITSHDRYFLDQVVDKIWELHEGKITEYWGGYSDYLKQKEEQLRVQAEHYKKVKDERERLEKAVIEKKEQARKLDQKAKGATRKNHNNSGGRLGHQKSEGSKQRKLHSAARNLEHRMKELDDIQTPESVRTIRFRQSKALGLHNPFPIMGDHISKQFGEKVIFEQTSFQFPLGAKIALTGANGSGKTTLFKMILNRNKGITLSPKAKIGYFAQNAIRFESKQGVLEFLAENSDYPVSEIRAGMAAMGFTEQDIRKDISVLSGGEMIKLQLTKMLLGQYNILLMDEPSNFLELPAIEALEQMMKNYKGTIVFASHDRHLVNNVANVVYQIEDKKIIRKV